MVWQAILAVIISILILIALVVGIWLVLRIEPEAPKVSKKAKLKKMTKK